MQCINCKSEIPAFGLVCPFCRYSPYLFGQYPPLPAAPEPQQAPDYFIYDGAMSGLGQFFRKLFKGKIGSCRVNGLLRCNKCGYDGIVNQVKKPGDICGNPGCNNEL